MITATSLIEKFNLRPHPEGGHFMETYRSAETIVGSALPPRFGAERNVSTAIYFLLEAGQFSAFHRIKSDECWHFYAGGTLLIHIIDQAGNLYTTSLGGNLANDERFQFVVPAGCWFAGEPAEGTRFSFVGCTVAPGFDFVDFELAAADTLCAMYPQHKTLIERLC